MNLTEFTINRSRIALAIFIILAVLGFVTYQNLPRDSMPPYTVRIANVIAHCPGFSPDRVENLITDKIEKKVQEIPELKKLTSTSRTGISIVKVEITELIKKKDLQPIWNLLRRKLELETFPEGVRWYLDDDGIGDVYGIVVGLVSESEEAFSYHDLKDYADDIRDALIKLDNAGKVATGGLQQEQIFVDYDNAQIVKYGITGQQIHNAIATTNILFSGGEINLGQDRITLEPTGNFNEVNDLKELVIRSEEGKSVIKLGDIARITRGYETPPTHLVRVDGKRAISFHVFLKEGRNVIQLGKDIDARCAKLQKQLPYGLELKRLASLDNFIQVKISEFIVNLIQSIVIVLLVMLIFLGARTGIIISSLIPMVILGTFGIMGLLNVGINQVTLAALIIGLGMMVDNAVVISESILLKLSQGKSKYDAAVESSSEMAIPLLISTLTTAAAFLAFFLAETTMGDIMGPLFIVISTLLLLSWFLSLSMVAFMCYIFLKLPKKDEQKKEKIFDRVVNKLKIRYNKLIRRALNHKPLVLIIIVGIFILSIMLFKSVPFLFLPDSDRNLITVDINLPEGTSIDRTSEIVAELETYMKEKLLVGKDREKGILDWSSYIGEGPESYDLGYTQDQPNTNYAHILVNTSSGEENLMVIAAIDDFCFSHFPSANVRVTGLKQGSSGTPIQIEISGDDPDHLQKISRMVKAKLNSFPHTKNVKDNWGPKQKKIVIDIDPLKVQNARLTNRDVALALQTTLSGIESGQYREGIRTIPIMIKDKKSFDLTIDQLHSVNVISSITGLTVPLLQIAEIKTVYQYPKIQRKGIFKTITVSSEIKEGGNADAIMNIVVPWLNEQRKKEWREGYTYTLDGDAKSTADNMGSVMKYLPLSGLIIVMLLIVQFNSFRKTLIILLTIPLVIIGVAIGLKVFREDSGFMPFLGIISLAGIIINNGIVLLDRIQVELSKGKKQREAVIDSCLHRFRPILLTTFTTMFGLLPLYFGGGSLWEAMAIAMIIGLLFGTVITLIFVPTIYSVLYREKKVEK